MSRDATATAGSMLLVLCLMALACQQMKATLRKQLPTNAMARAMHAENQAAGSTSTSGGNSRGSHASISLHPDVSATTKPRKGHSFLFVGGLQRSGTTWLEGLVASPYVSALSFDNIDLSSYQQRKPWRLQNHTQAYFEVVVRSGGVEGKFVQGVYPYVYLVRDVGKDGQPLDSMLLHDKLVASNAAEQLYAQWSLFWDTTKPMLLEKTPENFLMGPFLQKTFGADATRFAFVMRHPLVWALAIEKWIFPDFVALRTVEDRVAFWFDCMSRMVEQLPSLRDVLVLQLEVASASADVQNMIAKRLLCPAKSGRMAGRDMRLQEPDDAQSESMAILSSSLGYVACWLGGMEFKASLRRCVSRKAFREPSYRLQPERLAAENSWRLARMAREREVQANQFGYTFKPFISLTSLPIADVLRKRIRPEDSTLAQAGQLGVLPNTTLVRAQLRQYMVTEPPNVHRTPPTVQSHISGPIKHAMVVFHKMGVDREKPTGMDIRMTQIVQSLVDMRYTVHFLCHEDVHVSQLSPFQGNVRIYTGPLRSQFDQATTAASISSVLVFFTTLTMRVHQRMLQGDPSWYAEPPSKLPEEELIIWLREMPAAAAPCTIAVADDVHYLRIVEVMGRHNATKAHIASAWIRRRELAFHAAADGSLTVSLEDATTLRQALRQLEVRPARSATCKQQCGCAISWVPYIQVSKSHVEPFDSRHAGMLYVGGMHGLAVIAVEWLLQHVQPIIGIRTGRGMDALGPGGIGHLYLAGPGWSQHLFESRVLNQSVVAGYVTLLGTLTDEQLDQKLQELKAFVAPVLNGTGIATKNVLAMAHGIPLVTTSNGLNGLGLAPNQHAVLVADDPAVFAQHLLRLQTSKALFDATSSAALEHTRKYLSAERQRAALCTAIGCPTELPRGFHAVANSSSPLLCSGQVSSLSLLSPPRLDTKAEPGQPMIVIGLSGSGVAAVAGALRSSRTCMALDPLRGLYRAPLQAQFDHLHALLIDPEYCKVQYGSLPIECSEFTPHCLPPCPAG